ncbi:MAG: type IV pilin N-terminal domain-containing protein [Hadesarchaea archaeon]|nr:type IV pilin N-terminal domain-containing protein [Hadesarchaea archaeon]
MRSIKREARGISPVVATILLIAVTAVAAGVIASYVAGLYVATPPLISASASGMVYDYDSTAPLENYKNANASATVTVLSGTLRSVCDPAYGGTIIRVVNPTTGWSRSVSYSGTENWGGTYTLTDGSLTTGDRTLMTVKFSPDSLGRLGAGSSISILIQYFNTDAHADADNRRVPPAGVGYWVTDEGERLDITVSGRDSLTLTGYRGARLSGVSWAV